MQLRHFSNIGYVHRYYAKSYGFMAHVRDVFRDKFLYDTQSKFDQVWVLYIQHFDEVSGLI